MKSVGIKALKDNLSKYLKLVREGEIVWVTDRDEIIAEIHRPTTPVLNRVSEWHAFLNAEARNGRIKLATTSAVPSLNQINKENQKLSIDVRRLLDEMRDDRDLL